MKKKKIDFLKICCKNYMKDLLVKELVVRQRIADLIISIMKNEDDKEAKKMMASLSTKIHKLDYFADREIKN
tara:strand:- start:256 stop:471 length:216 start_codon:yes stop_codon:yes gene_type:complete